MATTKKGGAKTTEALAGELRIGVGMLLRRRRQAPTGDDLTLPEGSALARLDRYGPSTASELAKREQISPQSMGATTAALEARGLIERTADPGDGRRQILSPTEAGHAALRGAADRAPRPEHLTAARADDRPLGEGYKWTALANTTAAVFMSTLDGSIVLIAMPAIFRGIHLDPLAPENIVYLLWMIMGYRLVQAVLVVSVGRMGDMYGRVKIYNAGFVVFTAASILLSFDPLTGRSGALWLIGWRLLQALGGSMLTANSAAILTDAFPAEQRGFALGTNQVAGISGQFIGLVAGGLLAAVDWRLVFWVNVPVGIFGTLWAYWKLRETGTKSGGEMDWWGNLTFAIGLGAILVGVTYGIQPYGGHTMGWTNPLVLATIVGGAILLAVFAVIESRVAEPMFQLGLFKIRAF